MSTKFASLETSRGKIVAELFERDCPGTVENFMELANRGFYDGVRFHDVDAGRTVHGGDPLSRELPPGDERVGTGGPDHTIPCEVVGNRNRHERGALSMDHNGRDTGGSRFFFVLDDRVGETLNGQHTVFGMVEEGLEVLDMVEPNDVIHSVRVWE